jgi:hypothetical protein
MDKLSPIHTIIMRFTMVGNINDNSGLECLGNEIAASA